jgi:hypothetical protein
MSIRHNGKEYCFWFKHEKVDKLPVSTECFIQTGQELKDCRLWKGKAACSVKDSFSYSIGRKVSLAKALKQLCLSSNLGNGIISEREASKSLRSLFWGKYDVEIGFVKSKRKTYVVSR